MRISEDRYTRDLRRLHLARRLIQYEVRTRWICACTGLSGNRVRNLFHSYQESLGSARRRRGPSRRQVSSFLTSPTLRDEASAAGGLAYVLGVVGESTPVPGMKVLLTLESGGRLCDAFDLYREVMPDARLTLDQLIVLVNALTQGEELEIGHCAECHGTLIVDRLGIGRRICLACKEHRHRTEQPRGGSPAIAHESFAEASPNPTGVQLPLDL